MLRLPLLSVTLLITQLLSVTVFIFFRSTAEGCSSVLGCRELGVTVAACRELDAVDGWP
jgi:hypothetical protein